jgi:hypothetical protein
MMLLILRLDLLARRGSERSGPRLLIDDPDIDYKLLVTLLDPSLRTTGAPVSVIPLARDKFEDYNASLEGFQGIWKNYYRDGGYIDKPESYTPAQQLAVFKEIQHIGNAITRLFSSVSDPIDKWLENLFSGPTLGASLQPVTILTNDFDIPWFWLRKNGHFLCEVCSLGLLQLSATGAPSDTVHRPPGGKKEHEALLVKGAFRSTLPFLDAEIDRVEERLTEPIRGISRTFKALRATTRKEMEDLACKWDPPHPRTVHFWGHYSKDALSMEGGDVNIADLTKMLNGSLLVLDGSGSSRDLKSWADLDGLTLSLINLGALGCVVTALPVKHDPIVSRILWDTFYRNLRYETGSVGQALAKARLALRDYFREIHSPNPVWAAYQMIGSPVVPLCEDPPRKLG